MLAQSAEPLEKRIRVEGVKTGRIAATDFPAQIEEALARDLLDASEAGSLRDYDRKVMELIHVDDFDAPELAAGSQTEATRATVLAADCVARNYLR